jgi:MoxR-like ATPase
VLLVGEPGVGKTSIVGAIAERMDYLVVLLLMVV